jgi:hypothetical protein
MQYPGLTTKTTSSISFSKSFFILLSDPENVARREGLISTNSEMGAQAAHLPDMGCLMTVRRSLMITLEWGPKYDLHVAPEAVRPMGGQGEARARPKYTESYSGPALA